MQAHEGLFTSSSLGPSIQTGTQTTLLYPSLLSLHLHSTVRVVPKITYLRNHQGANTDAST